MNTFEIKFSIDLEKVDSQRYFGELAIQVNVTLVNAQEIAQRTNGMLYVNLATHQYPTTIFSTGNQAPYESLRHFCQNLVLRAKRIAIENRSKEITMDGRTLEEVDDFITFIEKKQKEKEERERLQAEAEKKQKESIAAPVQVNKADIEQQQTKGLADEWIRVHGSQLLQLRKQYDFHFLSLYGNERTIQTIKNHASILEAFSILSEQEYHKYSLYGKPKLDQLLDYDFFKRNPEGLPIKNVTVKVHDRTKVVALIIELEFPLVIARIYKTYP